MAVARRMASAFITVAKAWFACGVFQAQWPVRHPFDLFELRAVDVDISDAMLSCLDALRWGRSDLYRLVPNGEQRVRAVIRQWGLGAARD